MVAASESPPEASGRSVAWGLFLCVVFSVASAYSGLKVGQVMEARHEDVANRARWLAREREQ